MSYSWPGNVRELKSALEYAFVIARNKGCWSSNTCRPRSCRLRAGNLSGDTERAALIQALRAAAGNQTRAAKILGVKPGHRVEPNEEIRD